MLPVTAQLSISASREELYDHIADLALRPAWCDHYLKDYRLVSPRSPGIGAGARYQIVFPRGRLYMEAAIVEAESPRRIVERAHGGRNLRTNGGVTWELTRAGTGLTRVEITTWHYPGTPRDVFKKSRGMQGGKKRRKKAALGLLRLIFEEGAHDPLARATVAGFE